MSTLHHPLSDRASHAATPAWDGVYPSTPIVPRLGRFAANEGLPPVRDLVSAIIRQPRIDSLLESLSQPARMRRFIEILLRSETDCREFLIDRVAEAEGFSELLGGLSADDTARLANETTLLSEFHQKIEDAGFVPEWIDHARRITRAARLPREETAFAYDIVRSLNLVSNDLRCSLELFAAHADSTLSSRSLARYSLEPLLCFTENNACPGRLHSLTYETFPEPRSPSGCKSFWVWMDSPFGLMIKRDGIPQALLSFSAEPRAGMLRIEQMQGLRGVACSENGKPLDVQNPRYFGSALHGLAFRDFFVDITENVAQSNDCCKVTIVGSQNNIWTKPNRWKAIPTYTVEAARRAYDEVARRRSYNRTDEGDWERLL